MLLPIFTANNVLAIFAFAINNVTKVIVIFFISIISHKK